MSYQEVMENAVQKMLDQTSGFALERKTGREIVHLLLGLRGYNANIENIDRTRYHGSGIDIYVSTSDNNHAFEFTTDAKKGPEDDWGTVKRDGRSVDVYWFVTSKRESDPTYPEYDGDFEGVGLTSILEAIDLKTGSRPGGPKSLKKISDLTGYEFEGHGEVNLEDLSQHRFYSKVKIHPTLVTMWPESHHNEVIEKIVRISKSFYKIDSSGEFYDFIESDKNDSDRFLLRIDTDIDTIEVEPAKSTVNPPPEMVDEIQVDYSEKGVDKLYIPIRICEGNKANPQTVKIEPIERLR